MKLFWRGKIWVIESHDKYSWRVQTCEAFSIHLNIADRNRSQQEKRVIALKLIEECKDNISTSINFFPFPSRDTIEYGPTRSEADGNSNNDKSLRPRTLSLSPVSVRNLPCNRFRQWRWKIQTGRLGLWSEPRGKFYPPRCLRAASPGHKDVSDTWRRGAELQVTAAKLEPTASA